MDSFHPINSRSATITSSVSAPQHGPRPLPLFLQMVLQHSNSDAAKIQAVMAGLRQYQDAPRVPRPEAISEIARVGRARLLDYGGAGRPVLFVPSLINPPYVLDLAEGNSLLRWLAARGFRIILLDWGHPGHDDRDLTVAGHVETLLLPLMAELGKDIVLAGYCLGATMALAAAACTPPKGLLLIASPWNFTAYPSDERQKIGSLWQSQEPVAQSLGVFPMEMLQSAFWQLDPQRTLEKYAAFGTMDRGSPEAAGFVALEDWANEGPPLTLSAARELLVDMFGNNVTGAGHWRAAEMLVDPAAITCPVLNVISTTDRIVPAAAAPDIGERLILRQGHVGMVVGRRAPATLWEPIAAWLSQLRHG